jgi:hypothetical protein
MRPGDCDLAERASIMALTCFREGYTVGEACRHANAFIESWTNHPAHPGPDDRIGLRLVS